MWWSTCARSISITSSLIYFILLNLVCFFCLGLFYIFVWPKSLFIKHLSSLVVLSLNVIFKMNFLNLIAHLFVANAVVWMCQTDVIDVSSVQMCVSCNVCFSECSVAHPLDNWRFNVKNNCQNLFFFNVFFRFLAIKKKRSSFWQLERSRFWQLKKFKFLAIFLH